MPRKRKMKTRRKYLGALFAIVLAMNLTVMPAQAAVYDGTTVPQTEQNPLLTDSTAGDTAISETTAESRVSAASEDIDTIEESAVQESVTEESIAAEEIVTEESTAAESTAEETAVAEESTTAKEPAESVLPEEGITSAEEITSVEETEITSIEKMTSAEDTTSSEETVSAEGIVSAAAAVPVMPLAAFAPPAGADSIGGFAGTTRYLNLGSVTTFSVYLQVGEKLNVQGALADGYPWFVLYTDGDTATDGFQAQAVADDGTHWVDVTMKVRAVLRLMPPAVPQA